MREGDGGAGGGVSVEVESSIASNMPGDWLGAELERADATSGRHVKVVDQLLTESDTTFCKAMFLRAARSHAEAFPGRGVCKRRASRVR